MKTWLIRFLLFIVFVIAAALLMLSLLGGTGESHRKGLERSFSDFLKADVSLGRLEQFNIVPQLSLKTQEIKGRFLDSGNEFMIDRLDLAFGFSDLALGRKKIENFRLENLRFSKDSSLDLRIDYMRITDTPAFIVKGLYRRKDFNLSFPLNVTKTSRPAYSFTPGTNFSGAFGSLALKGRAGKENETNGFGQVDFFAGNKLIANGKMRKYPDGMYRLFLTCQKLPSEQKSDLAILIESEFVESDGTCR